MAMAYICKECERNTKQTRTLEPFHANLPCLINKLEFFVPKHIQMTYYPPLSATVKVIECIPIASSTVGLTLVAIILPPSLQS